MSTIWLVLCPRVLSLARRLDGRVDRLNLPSRTPDSSIGRSANCGVWSNQGRVRHDTKQTIPLEFPTVATFIWFSGARVYHSLTRATSDTHANPLTSSLSQLTGIRNRCEVASPSLARTHHDGDHRLGVIGWGLDDVTSRCCEFDSAVDLQPAVSHRLRVHAAFRSSFGQSEHADPQPRAWRRQTSGTEI